MFWRISQFPELDCLDPDERAAALRQVTVWTYVGLMRRAFAVGWFAALPFTAVAAGFAPRLARGAWVLAFFVTPAVVIAAIAYQWMLRRIHHAMRRELAAAYVGRAAPFCFRCGYDLRGIVHDPALGGPRVCPPRVCPECGGIDHASTRVITISRGAGRFFGGIVRAFDRVFDQ